MQLLAGPSAPVARARPVKESGGRSNVCQALATEIGSVACGLEHDLLCLTGLLHNYPARMLIDSGSTHDFVAAEFVQRHNILTQDDSEETLKVVLADGSTSMRPLQKTRRLKLMIGADCEERGFIVYPLSRYDAVLGKPWLSHNNPLINYRTNEVHLGGQMSTNSKPVIARSQPQAISVRSDGPLAENLFISAKRARKELRNGATGIIAMVYTAEAESDVTEYRIDVTGREREQLQHLLDEYQAILPKSLPTKLPPNRYVDHEIDVVPGSCPPSRAAYRLPKPELDEMQRQLTSLLEKGFIEPSKSPYGAPVFFVKKADKSLRMVCDWRDLNRITIKNKACLPNADDLFDVIQGSSYFSKLDLHSGYNQVRIHDDDVHKTAINTPFGHFHFRVMGFGLTNAPATFQTLMNDILRPYLRKFVVVFLDDILIFSSTWNDHLEHIRTVFEALRQNQLYCKPVKCQFGSKEIPFLGHRISGSSIAPDPEKLKAVTDWPCPGSVSEVRSFLGFANYFRRYIDHYSDISGPLEEVSGKNSRFAWNKDRQHAFEQLKQALLKAPVLSLANVDLPFRVITDASDHAVAGVLLQQGQDNPGWHPVAYASRKLTSSERNYTAVERETLAVIFALKTWRMYLFKKFELHTDNMGVLYLRTKPQLSKREARWIEFLADYDFTVQHRDGRSNMADPLSRRPDLQLNGIEFSFDVDPGLAESFTKGYETDPELAPIIKRLKTSNKDAIHDRYRWSESAKRLYLNDSNASRLCVPRGPLRLQLLKENHDCPAAGHTGRDRTYLKLARYFYWPGMSKTVKKFVKTCDRCQRIKGGQSRTGLLQSLPVPSQPWSDISMDFIMGLPLTCRGHNAILTFVDRLTKYVHLIPTTCNVDAEQSARLYIDNIFALHGLSRSIVCDRDPRFTSSFFKEVFSLLGTDIKMSTAHHPQTDGMTERVNRIVEDTLRSFVNHRQNNWDELLRLCEFAINDSYQASVGDTPFFLNHGQHPITPSALVSSGVAQNSSSDVTQCAWLDVRKEALRLARDAMVAAQARQAIYADRGRGEGDLKVGEPVLVHKDFLLTDEARAQPSDKLRHRWFGPFKILQHVAPNAYRLELPTGCRSHPVFNVTALKRYHANTITDRNQPPPPPVTDAVGHTRFIVDEILADRYRGRRRQYLVKWAGYPEPTWEPEENLQNEIGEDLIPLRTFKSRKES